MDFEISLFFFKKRRKRRRRRRERWQRSFRENVPSVAAASAVGPEAFFRAFKFSMMVRFVAAAAAAAGST